MTLAAGTRLGTYEILSPLGAGGMGEVYKAKDAHLDRVVALKVLPEEFFENRESIARFEREARMLASLNHPGIAHLYAFEEIPGSPGSSGRHLLVMELADGQTLAERLFKGPLALDQLLKTATEIASALDAAHRAGIVHRDLKPGNVMLTKSGAKLLDFGLAKVASPPGQPSALTSQPTELPKNLTQKGTILGTFQYMSPETLEGKEADARTDIFAFGAVLYEMATGRKAFSGSSRASLISAILRDEPAPVSASQPMTPPALDRVVRTCLAKDPEQRWQSAHDVGLQLRAISEGTATRGAAEATPRLLRIRFLPWLIAGVAVAIAVAVAALSLARGPRGQSPRTIRFSVPPPANATFSYFVEVSFLAVSPDGSQLAYVASDPQGGRRIFLRPLSGFEARPIPGTKGANSLVFSPDGRSIAFFAQGKLKRVELSGGAAVSICDVSPGPHLSGTWGRGGDILFSGVTRQAIYRVSAAGGTPAEVIRPDPSRGEARIAWPWFLPDGQRFLYLIRHFDGRSDLMLAEPGKKPRPVMAMQSAVQYVDPGYLVFAREGALLAQRFDPESGRVTGEPFSIAERVRYFLSTGAGSFAASRTGTLAYQSQDDVMRLVWLDRIGREVGTVGPPGHYLSVSIAPDGRRILFDRARPGIGTYDVWSFDLERGAETPVTSEPETEVYAVWLPGGKSVAYSAVRASSRAPQLFRKDLATGGEKELLPGGGFQIAQDVSSDGKSLVYVEESGHGWFDVWALPLSGGGKPVALLQAPFSKGDVRFSPDGRYLALITGESGQPEVYVTAYPGPGERIRVSTGGAQNLRWSRDGRELLYLSADQRMMSVPVRTSPSLELGAPTALFAVSGKGWADFDVSPDGKRFLAIVPKVVADELPLNVIVNWTPEVGK
jgi:serine/threonine protein kinase/Tol biopolymer transport system component